LPFLPEAGLAMLDRGGGFADGAIAYEDGWLGGKTLFSFDRTAVTAARAADERAQVLV